MKLILHIGTEKTGTTSIQSWLETNRAELTRRRVFLSNVLDHPSNRALAHAFQDSVDHYFLPMGITTVENVAAFRMQLMGELKLEIEAASKSHDQMVISSEQLQSRLLSTKEVARLAKFLRELFSEVTVVCYLRHQLEMRRSFYSTLVRMGYTGALEEFDAEIDEASSYYNHLALVQRWEDAFGRAQLLLREYSPAKLNGGDVVHDFVTHALPELDLAGLNHSRSSENAALSDAHVATYRAINRWMPYSDGMGRPRKSNARMKRLAQAVLNPFVPRQKRLAVSLREQVVGECIVARFAESNQRLSEAYFDGDLFSNVHQPNLDLRSSKSTELQDL